MRTTIEKDLAGETFKVKIKEYTDPTYGEPSRKIKVWRKSTGEMIGKREVEVNNPSIIDRYIFGDEPVRELPPREEHVESAFEDIVGDWVKKKLETRKAEQQFRQGLDKVDDSDKRQDDWGIDQKRVTIELTKQEVGLLLYGEEVIRRHGNPVVRLTTDFERESDYPERVK